MPSVSEKRKDVPLATGVLDYFPNALAEVARLSRAGNDKHNPGEPLHWARGKSMDHADCIIRHLADRGTVDEEDGISHSAKVAWRALALLEEELEAAGAKPGRGSKFPADAAIRVGDKINGTTYIGRHIVNAEVHSIDYDGDYAVHDPHHRFRDCLVLVERKTAVKL